jgi:asparagine synthase (glutamine-hydrolysing)
MARAFFGRGLQNFRAPGFSHEPRWHSASALKRLFSAEQREASRSVDVVGRLLASLPPAFASWSTLARDQYLEVRTLLTGYILSSQGDRMLMAHSVEGRFPFLDAEVMELANSLPPAYKLKVLDEKHVLKRASRGLVPEAILARKKQPYRAPDALCFTGPRAPDWVREALSEASLRAAGVFDARAVGQLWAKCQSRTGEDQFSNADNMALVGILSTQLLHEQLVVKNAFAGRNVPLTTHIDHLAKS